MKTIVIETRDDDEGYVSREIFAETFEKEVEIANYYAIMDHFDYQVKHVIKN